MADLGQLRDWLCRQLERIPGVYEWRAERELDRPMTDHLGGFDTSLEDRFRRLERASGIRPPLDVWHTGWDSHGHFWGDWRDSLTGETAKDVLPPTCKADGCGYPLGHLGAHEKASA